MLGTLFAAFLGLMTTDPKAGLIGAVLVVAGIGALKFAATGYF